MGLVPSRWQLRFVELPPAERCDRRVTRPLGEGGTPDDQPGSTGEPYKHRTFTVARRKVADKAGVPKNVWNMDARAGAIPRLTRWCLETDVMKHAGNKNRQTSVPPTGARLRDVPRCPATDGQSPGEQVEGRNEGCVGMWSVGLELKGESRHELQHAELPWPRSPSRRGNNRAPLQHLAAHEPSAAARTSLISVIAASPRPHSSGSPRGVAQRRAERGKDEAHRRRPRGSVAAISRDGRDNVACRRP
jgi:hypothetical protein